MSSNFSYFDYAAATPVDPLVLQAMEPFWSTQFYNPSSLYLASRSVRQALDSARSNIAYWLGARPAEIIFTAGATEANNLAIKGIQAQYSDAAIAISSIEHEAVRVPARHFSQVIELPVDQYGHVILEQLSVRITDATVLVSIMYANNEIGTVQHMSAIRSVLDEIRAARAKRGIELPLYLHTDASQAANYLDLHVDKLGVELMTLNAAKTYGPKQSGALYIQSGVMLESIIEGGGQEQGLRSGTEDIVSAVGLAAALELAQTKRKAEQERMHHMRGRLITQLKELHSEVQIHSHRTHTLPNIVSFSIAGLDAERVVMALDELGILCATGAACSAASDEPSHVLLALGYNHLIARATVRLSMGRFTTEADVDRCIAALKQVIATKHNWLAT